MVAFASERLFQLKKEPHTLQKNASVKEKYKEARSCSLYLIIYGGGMLCLPNKCTFPASQVSELGWGG